MSTMHSAPNISKSLTSVEQEQAEEYAHCHAEGLGPAATLAAVGATPTEFARQMGSPDFMREVKRHAAKLERQGTGIKAQAQRELRGIVNQISGRINSVEGINNADLAKFGELLLKTLALLDRRDDSQVKHEPAASHGSGMVRIIINTNPVRIGRPAPRDDLLDVTDVTDISEVDE
jgi:hypothetical protein